MRISADMNDPDYVPATHSVVVLLDGQPVQWVVSADTGKGVVICLKRDEQGRFLSDGDQMATETLQGRVSVFIPTHRGDPNTTH